MSENYSKARQTAEKAFNKVQVKTADREDPMRDVDAAAHARQQKTFRLREARLAKEAQFAVAPSTEGPTTS